MNATIVDRQDWSRGVGAFAEEVRSGPTVQVWTVDDTPSGGDG